MSSFRDVFARLGIDLDAPESPVAVRSPSNAVALTLPVRGPALPDTGEFTGGMPAREKPDFNRVAAHCEVVKEAVASGGVGHSNGRWHQLVYLSTFADNGRAWAHKMSAGWAGYDPARVDQEYDRCEAERARDPSKGWTNCAAMKSLAPAECGACAIAPHVTSPLSVGTPAGYAKVQTAIGLAQQPAGTMPLGIPLARLFSTMNLQRRRFVLGTRLGRGFVALLAAQTKAGKTTYAILVVLSLATGKPIAGEKVLPRKLRVVYINAEEAGQS